MCNEEKVEAVLRMMCLLSLTQSGLPKRSFDGLRKELLHTYGHQHLITLQALQTAGQVLCANNVSIYSIPEPGTYTAARAGLLKLSKGGKPPFATVSKALKLMVDNWDPKDPADPAYVFSGYAPISIRLVEAALRCAHCNAQASATQTLFSNSIQQLVFSACRNPPWSGVPEEALKLLPGPHFTRKRARFSSQASGTHRC